MSNLTIISKYHDYWIKIVKSFGEKEPEDFVQDMYLIACQNSKVVQDSKPNYAYIYAILRSIWLKTKRNNKIADVPLSTIEIDETTYHDWVDELSEEVKKEIDSLPFFDGTIFNLVHNSGKSVRKMSKESGISVRTIWYSYNKTKQTIADKFKSKYDECKEKD